MNLVCTYNIQETYVDDADPLMGTLAKAAFAVRSTYHRTKDKSLGQLVFGRYMIIPVNPGVDRRYTHQRKKTQINKDVNCEYTTRIYHGYIVGDKVMTKNRSAYKYETTFRGPYEIVHIFTNN